MPNGPNSYRAVISEQEYDTLVASCQWVMGRYSWGDLLDYLVCSETMPVQHSVEINYEDAWRLFNACYTDNSLGYPCAGNLPTQHLDAIFQHYAFLEPDEPT